MPRRGGRVKELYTEWLCKGMVQVQWVRSDAAVDRRFGTVRDRKPCFCRGMFLRLEAGLCACVGQIGRDETGEMNVHV